MNNEEWNAHNGLLQQAYRAYLHAVKQKEKDEACMKIQRELEWPPFEDLCFENSAPISGISRYGLDSVSEKCIDIINKIAKGEVKKRY
jgi:hypothetical protein